MPLFEVFVGNDMYYYIPNIADGDKNFIKVLISAALSFIRYNAVWLKITNYWNHAKTYNVFNIN